MSDPPPLAGARNPALGKADAERLVGALDDHDALCSALVSVLARLTGAGPGSTLERVVALAAPIASWTPERSALLCVDGDDGHRARVALARALAEERSLT